LSWKNCPRHERRLSFCPLALVQPGADRAGLAALRAVDPFWADLGRSRWYAQGEGQTLWQLFTSLNTYQFYRPIAIWLNRQLVAPDGVIAAQTAHFIQITAHMLAVLAAVPVLSVFKFERQHARMAALIFALYPLSYQAVAWQAPQQPIAMLAVFVAILLAARFVQRRRSRYLIASLIAYAFALLFQESALPFVVMFFWLAWLTEPINRSAMQRRDFCRCYISRWRCSSSSFGLTCRKKAASPGADSMRACWPMACRCGVPLAALLSPQLGGVPALTQIALYAAIWLVLALGVWRWQGKRIAGVSTLWLMAGLLPW